MDEMVVTLKSGVSLIGTVQGASIGTTDHATLANRDIADQHPIDAITGLRDVVDELPAAMTADELRKILNGGK